MVVFTYKFAVPTSMSASTSMLPYTCTARALPVSGTRSELEGSLKVCPIINSSSSPLKPTPTFDEGRVMMKPISRVSLVLLFASSTRASLIIVFVVCKNVVLP